MSGRLQIEGQVAVHKLGAIRVVGWPAKQVPESIMHRQVERRTTDQRRQPGHRLLAAPRTLVESLEPGLQNGLLKVMADLDGMSDGANTGPEFRQLDTKLS